MADRGRPEAATKKMCAVVEERERKVVAEKREEGKESGQVVRFISEVETPLCNPISGRKAQAEARCSFPEDRTRVIGQQEETFSEWA